MSATILVVDDDPDLREFLTILLATEGYAVFSASDEEQALALFKANEVDLVIVDLIMPKINGLTLLKEFKSERPAIKSVIFSGALSNNRLTAHKSRIAQLADELVEKPVKSEHFLAVVKKVLGA